MKKNENNPPPITQSVNRQMNWTVLKKIQIANKYAKMFNIFIYQKNASQKDIETLLDPSQKGSHGENKSGLPRWLSRKKHLLQSLIICLPHVVEGTNYHKWSSDPHTCAAVCGHMFVLCTHAYTHIQNVRSVLKGKG